MKKWLHARSVQLLAEINKMPFSDDCDEIKLQLIMTALRESSVKMFKRAAEKSRKATAKPIHDVEEKILSVPDNKPKTPNPQKKTTSEPQSAFKFKSSSIKEASEDKPAPKIKLSSSVIRRADSS